MGYWRFVAIKQSFPPASISQTLTQDQPLEVPKTLPAATIDDKVKSLEDTVSKIVTQVNSLKTQESSTPASLDARLKKVEAAIVDLTARVSALEKSTPAQVSTSQSVIYIPLGSGGGPWGNQGWYSLSEYQVSLNPGNYPGYTVMYLEVIFRLTEKTGTGSVRLYNSTDNSVVSAQVDTISDSFTLQTSSSFKLATGTKTYQLQIQSTKGAPIQIQNARIRVNF